VAAASIDLLDAIAAELAPEAELDIATMFGSPGLRWRSKIVAFLGRPERLIVKVPRARAEALVAEGSADPVTMGTRTMREWVSIAPAATAEATLETWIPLVREALAYVRSLP